MRGQPSREVMIRRFWSRVAKGDGCWTWTGKRSSGGYGRAVLDGKPQMAHRVSYALAYGAVPDGLMVLHRCDNRPCVRPDHLFTGTAKDNMQDAISKGRNARGERVHGSRLTAAQAADIFRAVHSGAMVSRVAAEYGVPQSLVSGIKSGKKWKHVTREVTP